MKIYQNLGKVVGEKIQEQKSKLATRPIDLDAYEGIGGHKIPQDPQEFYSDFGYLVHPRTGRPVSRLADYQYNIWNDKSKYRLVIKSQKVGITTTCLLEDFQKAITTCRGKQILIIAQSLDHAIEHLRTLKSLVINSRYANYLINDSKDMIFREEKTKLREAYIKNPANPLKPTRIIALGANESAVWSWKDVKHIHMSDVAASNSIDDSGLFNAAFTRLANTEGSILIETPPRGQRGKVYEIYQSSKDIGEEKTKPESSFKIFEIPAELAVNEGLISNQFLQAERIRLGALYSQYYDCQFISQSNQWYSQDMLITEDYEVSM